MQCAAGYMAVQYRGCFSMARLTPPAKNTLLARQIFVGLYFCMNLDIRFGVYDNGREKNMTLTVTIQGIG